MLRQLSVLAGLLLCISLAMAGGANAEQTGPVLQPNEVVLEYLVLDDELLLMVVPYSGEFTVVNLDLPLLAEGQSFDSWLALRIVELYSKDLELHSSASRRLYDCIFNKQKVDGLLKEGQQLIICPDERLAAVPFEALTDADGRYLVERFPISYSMSATMLGYIRERGYVPYRPGEALVMGVYQGRSLSPLYGANSAVEQLGNTTRLQTEEVAGLLGVAPRLQLNETALREAMPGKSVIHLNSHGLAVTPSPLLNGILTFQDVLLESEVDANSLDPDNDGLLSMAEVMGLDLSGTTLVTLSCCETASGQNTAGAGIMGLTQGFLYARSASVIATLTSVDERPCRSIMKSFYANWLQGQTSKAVALQRAKLQYLADQHAAGFEAPPIEWAPFLLYGEPR